MKLGKAKSHIENTVYCWKCLVYLVFQEYIEIHYLLKSYTRQYTEKEITKKSTFLQLMIYRMIKYPELEWIHKDD